jgi:hypothetical protein
MPARPITQPELASLAEQVRRRVIRWFKRQGFLDREVPSYFQSLEHLPRHCARPPFALERLSVIHEGDSRIARFRCGLPWHKAANWVGPGRKQRACRGRASCWRLPRQGRQAPLTRHLAKKPGPSSWPGWGRSFRSSPQRAAATSG